MHTFFPDPESSFPGTGSLCFRAYRCLDSRPNTPFAGLMDCDFCQAASADSVCVPK